MKKSKILIPAFAVLALSVGASVTGTVAWFTASRSQSFNSSFAVTDVNGNLDIELTGNKNAGTSLNNDKKIVVDGSLTHGSFDAKNNVEAAKLYVASLSNNPNAGENDPKFLVDRYNDLGTIPEKPTNTGDGAINSKWLAGNDKNGNIWYGVSWEAKVTLGETAISGTNHLFLDFNTSTATNATKANVGFRLAVMGNDGDDAIVLANGADAQNKHVTGEAKEKNDGVFTKWHTFGETVAKAMDEQTLKEFKENAGYISQFADAVGGKSEIDLKFVAWFEGEDAAVVSANTVAEAVSATLSFYARRTTKTA